MDHSAFHGLLWYLGNAHVLGKIATRYIWIIQSILDFAQLRIIFLYVNPLQFQGLFVIKHRQANPGYII